jgi:hypothetical protein
VEENVRFLVNLPQIELEQNGKREPLFLQLLSEDGEVCTVILAFYVLGMVLMVSILGLVQDGIHAREKHVSKRNVLLDKRPV